VITGPPCTGGSGGTGSRDPPGSCKDKPNYGAIAGGTVGGVVAVILGILGAVMLRKRRQRRESQPPQVGRDGMQVVELSAGMVYTGYGEEVGTIRP